MTNKNKYLLYEQATKLMYDNDFKNALNLLKECHHLDPKNALYLTQLGFCCFQLRDYGSAIKCCSKALEYQPEMKKAMVTLGYAYWKNKNKKEALNTFKNVLKYYPDDNGALAMSMRISRELNVKDTKNLKKLVSSFLSTHLMNKPACHRILNYIRKSKKGRKFKEIVNHVKGDKKYENMKTSVSKHLKFLREKDLVMIKPDDKEGGKLYAFNSEYATEYNNFFDFRI